MIAQKIQKYNLNLSAKNCRSELPSWNLSRSNKSILEKLHGCFPPPPKKKKLPSNLEFSVCYITYIFYRVHIHAYSHGMTNFKYCIKHQNQYFFYVAHHQITENLVMRIIGFLAKLNKWLRFSLPPSACEPNGTHTHTHIYMKLDSGDYC